MGAKAGKEKLHPETIQQLQRHVDFTPDEINAWYQEYNNSLRKGEKELTRQEFMKVYNTLFQGDASEFAANVFRTFDKDGSGTVDFKEFLVGLCVSGSSDPEVKLRWSFQMYDINNDGFISKNEMMHIVSAIFNMTNAVVPKEVETPELMTEKLFEEYDSDQNGLISWEEFVDGAKRDPIILHLLECDPTPEVE